MGLTISDGYVVYKRGANSNIPYWVRKHQIAAADAATIGAIYPEETDQKYQIAGSRLVSLGQQELKKEIALIEKATGHTFLNTGDIKDFIAHFNEVLQGAKQFDAALERLRFALNKNSRDKQFRAPTAAVFFLDKLKVALSKNLNQAADSGIDKLIDQDFAAWTVYFNNLVDLSIDQALEAMLNIEETAGKELYGGKETWAELYEVSQTMAGFNNYFKKMVRSKIDFNKIIRILKEPSLKLNNKKSTGVSTMLGGKEKGLNLSSQEKARSMGGSVQEFIMQLTGQFGTGIKQAFSQGSRVSTGEIMKIDTMKLYVYDSITTIQESAQNQLDALDEALAVSRSLQSTVDIMEKYHNEYLIHLKDSFIVYGSTKAYSLSESFTGFGGGGKRKLQDAVSILSSAGVADSGSLERYINAAYNTGEGAILQGRRPEIEKNLKIGLMSAVAELLFDDWTTLGAQSGGATAIHSLQLEGLELPLSALLIATGEAMMSASADLAKGGASSFVNVSVELPKSYLYPIPNDPPAANKNEVLRRWQEQADTSRAESTFSIKFLANFKSIIKNWV